MESVSRLPSMSSIRSTTSLGLSGARIYDSLVLGSPVLDIGTHEQARNADHPTQEELEEMNTLTQLPNESLELWVARQKLLIEEKRYNGQMELLETLFIIPLHSSKMISNSDFALLFNPLPNIIKSLRLMLSRLNRNCTLAAVFYYVDLTVKLYEEYMRACDQRVWRIGAILEYEEFRTFVHKQEVSFVCRGTTLLDLLTRPVQRVAQYRSFFSSLLSHKIEEKEVELVQNLLNKFSILGEYQLANSRALQLYLVQDAVQRSLGMDHTITSIKRRLVIEGKLFERSAGNNELFNERYLWLFSDILIIARTDCLGENTRHKPLYILPVIGMNVLYIPIEGVIAVSCDDVVLHFTSNSFTSLRNWMDEFRRCLSVALLSRKNGPIKKTVMFRDFVSAPISAKRSGKYKVHDVQVATGRLKIDESYKASDEFSSSPTDRQHKKLQRLTAQAIRSDNFDNNSRLTEELNSLRRESTPVEDSDELVAKRSLEERKDGAIRFLSNYCDRLTENKSSRCLIM